MRQCFRSRWFQLTVSGLLLAISVTFGVRWWFDRYLIRAQQSVDKRDWPQARNEINTYLQFRPRDSKARLMLAEAFIRDNKLAGDEKVTQALDQLSRIPDDSPRAAEARLQEGRLYMLLRLQPGRAAQAFLRSVRLDPTRQEPHMLLWRLYVLTNRWDSAEEHFWKSYEYAAESEQLNLLREWYLSEFSPGTANIELERRLGLLGETELPTNDSDRRRLEAFTTAEPDWVDGYAILARWHHRYGGLQQADKQLERAEKLPGGDTAPLVIATRVSVSIELGQFDRAMQAFQKWPPPHDGYEYHKTAGLIADQISRDNLHACDAYEHAVNTTAGKSDWLTQHRLAQSLLRSGKHEQAATVREHSKAVELLMETGVHSRLRRALLTPREPESIGMIVNLYRQLGRDREVEAWKQLTTDARQANL